MTRRTASSALSCTCRMYACTTSRPKWSIILPHLLDALLVRGDLGAQVGEVGSGLRDGYGAAVSSSRVSSSRNRPSSTSSQLSNSTPSSCTLRLCAGMEPGVMPPISAWWPREAT